LDIFLINNILRIISGQYRAIKLIEPPKDKQLRPISNKNLKNIINILYSGNLLSNLNINISEIKLLDLFAGTGIFSFENLSQNIASATMIDLSQKNIDIIKENGKLLKINDKIKIIKYNLANSLPKLPDKYHLIFADPPYNQNLTEKIFQNLEENYLEKKHLVIIESDKKEKLKFNHDKFQIIKEKIYGKSKFSFLVRLI
jgi:16S rRNA (guanine966-N2)-methyltransferase